MSKAYVNRGSTILKVANNQTISRFKDDPAYVSYKEAEGLNPPDDEEVITGGGEGGSGDPGEGAGGV